MLSLEQMASMASFDSECETSTWLNYAGTQHEIPQHWRERAAQRQQHWSRLHGFKMGRKIGDWANGKNGEDEALVSQEREKREMEDAIVQAVIMESMQNGPDAPGSASGAQNRAGEGVKVMPPGASLIEEQAIVDGASGKDNIWGGEFKSSTARMAAEQGFASVAGCQDGAGGGELSECEWEDVEDVTYPGNAARPLEGDEQSIDGPGCTGSYLPLEKRVPERSETNTHALSEVENAARLQMAGGSRPALHTHDALPESCLQDGTSLTNDAETGTASEGGATLGGADRVENKSAVPLRLPALPRCKQFVSLQANKVSPVSPGGEQSQALHSTPLTKALQELREGQLPAPVCVSAPLESNNLEISKPHAFNPLAPRQQASLDMQAQISELRSLGASVCGPSSPSSHSTWQHLEPPPRCSPPGKERIAWHLNNRSAAALQEAERGVAGPALRPPPQTCIREERLQRAFLPPAANDIPFCALNRPSDHCTGEHVLDVSTPSAKAGLDVHSPVATVQAGPSVGKVADVCNDAHGMEARVDADHERTSPISHITQQCAHQDTAPTSQAHTVPCAAASTEAPSTARCHWDDLRRGHTEEEKKEEEEDTSNAVLHGDALLAAGPGAFQQLPAQVRASVEAQSKDVMFPRGRVDDGDTLDRLQGGVLNEVLDNEVLDDEEDDVELDYDALLAAEPDVLRQLPVQVQAAVEAHRAAAKDCCVKGGSTGRSAEAETTSFEAGAEAQGHGAEKSGTLARQSGPVVKLADEAFAMAADDFAGRGALAFIMCSCSTFAMSYQARFKFLE
jgi:hypothetical protein